jgi:hypothetical protein
VQAALESAIHALAFGPEIDLESEPEVRAWLERHGVSARDADAIVARGAAKLGIYRRLLRGNLFEAVEIAIPRVVARLGDVFREYFDRYLAAHGPRSRYLRHVTTELLDFCEPLWPSDPRVPSYMMDLARHENVQIEVASMLARPLEAEPGELDLERPLRFIEAVRLMRYDHAVHRLSDSLEDRTQPAAEPTALLVYRNPEHEVRYLELTPLAAAILERLLIGEALGAAITRSCAELGTTPDAAVLEGCSRLLADLAERGALLGAR